jgi:hypothetical protein
MTQKDSLATRRSVVNRLGIFILLLGVVCAGTVYWTGKNRLASRSHGWETVDNGSRDDTLSFEDSKTSSRSTEMNFGKVGVLVSIWFRRWEAGRFRAFGNHDRSEFPPRGIDVFPNRQPAAR